MTKSKKNAIINGFREQRLCLRKHAGAQEYGNVPCLLKRLTMDDYEKVDTLHEKIAENTSRELFIPTTEEDLTAILSGEGIGLGIEYDGKLICLRLLMFESHVSLAEETLCFADWGSEKSCFMETCIVDKDFRGNNLQFLTYYHIENLLWGHFDSIWSTVSPHNIFSFRNILHCGFYAYELKECYGGYMRFLLRKGLTNRVMIDAHKYNRAKVTDYEKQQAILAQHKVGYRMNRNSAGSWMLYAPIIGAMSE